MKKILGFICVIWAVIFTTLETKYFGSNWLPKTKEELICDITSLFLLAAGYILFLQKRK